MEDDVQELEKMLSFAEQLQSYDNRMLTLPIQPGKWSIREITAHLYYWDRHMTESVMPQAADGAVLSPLPYPEIFNRAAVASLEGRAASAIISNFIEVRKGFIEQIKELSEETHFIIRGTNGEFSRSRIIQMFAEHDQHHKQQMHDFLLQQTRQLLNKRDTT